MPLTIAVLGRMRLVCAMRLHALVFSAAADAPFIAASYDIKVSSFMRYIGADACCGLESLDAAWLRAQIDRMMTAPRDAARESTRARRRARCSRPARRRA